MRVIYIHGSNEAIEKYTQNIQRLQLGSNRVSNPPRNGAIFVQAISGTVYLMDPQENRREVHPRILETMPEPPASAGFISSSGEITQKSGKVNEPNFNIRNLNEHRILGPVFAERVKLHYDLGDVKWKWKEN